MNEDKAEYDSTLLTYHVGNANTFILIPDPRRNSLYASMYRKALQLCLIRAPQGGYFEPPSRFLPISSKPMQVSPPNLQYPLSQYFLHIVVKF